MEGSADINYGGKQWQRTLLSPKSVTLASPSESKRMLAGLRS